MTFAASEIALKSFVENTSSTRKDQLLDYLPPHLKKKWEKIPFSTQKNKEPIPLLERIHWSWFLPTLSTYPKEEQELFLNALPPSSKKNLEHELGFENAAQEIPLSFFVKKFLQQTLLQSLTGTHSHLLPMEYLPDSPLNRLLNLSKQEFTKLIDFLSLYDLAEELRQIVETKILKRIYSFLSEEKKKVLKIAMHDKEPFLLTRIGLDKWEGTNEALSHLLHRRGLGRLAISLSGQNGDLVWYICHQLDIGRGNALFKLYSEEKAPLSEAATRQVETLLQMQLEAPS